MNSAVFLDRDGVINPNVFNPDTGQWESPHKVEDFILYPWTLEALHKLRKHDYSLFLVSNQPSYAKGKTTLQQIISMHKKFVVILKKNRIEFSDHFYCYHHPQGIIAEYSGTCVCRKPSPFFLKEAERKYRLDFQSSWMIGDRDTDITCGRAAGVKTILVRDKHEANKTGNIFPDYEAKSLIDAVHIIIGEF